MIKYKLKKTIIFMKNFIKNFIKATRLNESQLVLFCISMLSILSTINVVEKSFEIQSREIKQFARELKLLKGLNRYNLRPTRSLDELRALLPHQYDVLVNESFSNEDITFILEFLLTFNRGPYSDIEVLSIANHFFKKDRDDEDPGSGIGEEPLPNNIQIYNAQVIYYNDALPKFMNTVKTDSLFKKPISLSAAKLPPIPVVKSISSKTAVLEKKYDLVEDPNCIRVSNNSIKGFNDNVEPYTQSIGAYRPDNKILNINQSTDYGPIKNEDGFNIYNIDKNGGSENSKLIIKEAYIKGYNKYLKEWLDDKFSKLENITESNNFSLKTKDINSNYNFVKSNLQITEINKVIKNPYGFKYNYNFKSEHPTLEVICLQQEAVFSTLTPTIELVEFCVLNTNNAFYVGLFVPALGSLYIFEYIVLLIINLVVFSLMTSSIKELANNTSLLVLNKDIKKELDIVTYKFFNLLLLGFIGSSVISLNFPLFVKTSSVYFTKNLLSGNIQLNKYYAIKHMDID
uniref:hypothetical protein n=1 Tax=Ulva meridionalis TaxID=434723 RepID=UPI0028E0A1C8|nr:hypothetical protein NQY40_pgp088 [Ulva meridionalis]WFS80023.1 hypothetical protein [Ulva meridionalis]